jgi:hypothetical protein
MQKISPRQVQGIFQIFFLLFGFPYFMFPVKAQNPLKKTSGKPQTYFRNASASSATLDFSMIPAIVVVIIEFVVIFGIMATQTRL